MSKKIESPHIPSWPPNWENVSDYEFPEMRKEGWAWQFLRRNKEYQADFSIWLKAKRYYDAKRIPDCPAIWAAKCDPEPKGKEKLSTWEKRHMVPPPGISSSAILLPEYIKQRYYLLSPIDPAEYLPETLSFSQRGPKRIMGEGRYGSDTRQVVMSFDAGIDFSRQYAKAEILFKQALKVRQKPPRLRPHDLGKYLRIYDALQSDASRHQIIKSIYGGKDKPGDSATSEAYRTNKITANNLVDQLGYVTRILPTA